MSSSSQGGELHNITTGAQLLHAIVACGDDDAQAQALADRLRRRSFPSDGLTHQNEKGLSPLHAAVVLEPSTGTMALLQTLLDTAAANAATPAVLALRDGRMRSPLLLAAERANAPAFLCLWERRPNKVEEEMPDCFGRTALHWWAKHGDAACLQAVLQGEGNTESGVVNARTTSGETPLVWALEVAAGANADRAEVVRLLLAAGADARAAATGMGQKPLELLPPKWEGNAAQERVRALLEGHLKKEEGQEEEEEEGGEFAAAPAVSGPTFAPPRLAAAPTATSATSMMSFVGKGRGAGVVGAGVGVGGPPKKLKIKLKGGKE